jgi:hypothetical protein
MSAEGLTVDGGTGMPAVRIGLRPTRSTFDAGRIALWALILRDLVVLRKHVFEFVIRVLVQPFLLCFVFLYVFPKIGQGIGGGGGRWPSRPSPRCWCPAWWASPSCSRACSRWR